MSGIFRDVYLWSPPNVHIRDHEVITDLDEQYRDAEIRGTVRLVNYGKEPATVDHPAYPAGPLRRHRVDASYRENGGRPAEELVLEGKAPFPNPLKWSAETPNLYKLLIALEDSSGKTLEVIPCNLGFREVEIKDGNLLVNGRRVLDQRHQPARNRSGPRPGDHGGLHGQRHPGDETA